MSTSSTPLPPISHNNQPAAANSTTSKKPTPTKMMTTNLTPKQRKQQELLSMHTNTLNLQPNNNSNNNSSSIDPKLAKYYQPFHSYILNPSSTVKDEAKRTHPKGFRYRVMSSPMERNMNSYFRLPTEPPKRSLQEFSGVHKQAAKAERKRMKEIKSAKSLNGFALLSAADNAEDPTTVVEVSVCGKNFGSVVSEDLTFFTSLRVLDAGDNEGLTLSQFSTLPALEELHLHCNMLSNIVMPENSASSMLLHTLNVAFNRLTRRDFITIGKFCPALQRLDFSHNILGTLNREEDQLGRNGLFCNLTQLAIENNNLSNGTAILTALSELPHLQELNCNNNKFEAISILPPPPSQQQQQTNVQNENQVEGDDDQEEINQQQQEYIPVVPFPSLNTLGLAHNQIASIEAIASLSRFPSLRRVILWGNPLQKQRRFESDLVSVEFESIGVQALMHEPSKMNRAKVGKFYNKNDCPFFAVEATEGSGLPRSMVRRGAGNKNNKSRRRNNDLTNTNFNDNNMNEINQEQQQHHQEEMEERQQKNNNNDLVDDNNIDQKEDENNTGPSFFMTEGDDIGGNNNNNNTKPRTMSTNSHQQEQQQQQQQSIQLSPANRMVREKQNTRSRVQANAISAGILPSTFGQPMRSLSANENANSNNNSNRRNLDPIVEGNNVSGIGNLLNEEQGNNNSNEGGSSAGATLRSVVGDLRRALRQPLPPLPL